MQLDAVRAYLKAFEKYYPEILDWFDRTKEDFNTSRRTLLYVTAESVLVGVVIIKYKIDSVKLCHFSLAPALRDVGLGTTLMAITNQELVRYNAVEGYVTTSCEIYCRHRHFFLQSGFIPILRIMGAYRPDSCEVIWKKDLSTVEVTAQNYSWTKLQIGDYTLHRWPGQKELKTKLTHSPRKIIPSPS